MSLTKCGTAAMISIMLVGRVLGAEIPTTKPALDREAQTCELLPFIFYLFPSTGPGVMPPGDVD